MNKKEAYWHLGQFVKWAKYGVHEGAIYKSENPEGIREWLLQQDDDSLIKFMIENYEMAKHEQS
jgi:hypothetical protein